MAAVSAACVAVPALPQFTLLGDGGTNGGPTELKGKPAVDLIPGIRRGLGYPLRNDNVVPGTTEVFVGGRKLSNSEFSIDCPTGVLYVAAEVNESDSIRVIYRHDDKADETKNRLGALPLMTLNFGNGGSMTMLMGIGGADRENGSVMQSNNLGFKNNFSLGKANVSGLFMRSSRENAFVEGDSASPENGGVREGEESSGTLIKQGISLDVGNGMTLSAEYQDIDQSFTGFNMLASSGLDEKDIKQLEKEKGITRMGFGFNGGSPKSLQFSNAYRTIEDGNGKITFHNYGVKSNGIEAYYNARNIDSQFSRFKDLAEKERDQFKKERGLSREQFGGAFSMQGAKLSFDRNTISQDDAGLVRQSIGFESSFLKGSYKTQSVDQNFSRTGDLAEDERGQWGKERGMSREEMSFAIPRGDKTLASFGMQNVEYGDGRKFDATSFGFNNKLFNVQFWNRSTDGNFNRLDDLRKDELANMAANVLHMYDPTAKVRDQDRNWVAREAGLNREFLKFDGSPIKGGAFSFSTLGIDSTQGGISRSVLDLSYGNYKFGYQNTNIDQRFNRMGDLLEIERNLYGNQIGFDREEWNLAGKVTNGLDFSIDSLAIDEGESGLERFRANLKGSGFELQGGMRNVDSTFLRTGDVNDPERDLLTQLVGFNQKDLALKFDRIKGVKFSGLFFDADNGDENKRRFRNEAALLLNPDSKTEFEISYRDHQYLGAKEDLFKNTFSRLRGTRNFGKLGTLTLMHETEEFGGTESNQPSRDTNYLKYETKLGKGFDFMTEQGRTEFADGGFENYQGYKLGWQVTKRLGLNVEQVFVDRDKGKRDNQSTNFGFTYDFGNNLKIGYTFREDVDSVVGGKKAFQWNLTEGNFGGFNMGGSYSQNSQTGREDSFLGNFSLSNPKPFNFGFMKDVKISIGYDGKNEIGNWHHEKRLADFAATVLGSGIGFNYSQVLMPGGVVAVQRAATFNLDPSGKDPLQFSAGLKVRTMPNGEGYFIRDIDASYKLNDKLTISHTTDDLPEKAHNQAVFGTNLLPTLERKWALDYKPSKSFGAKFGYEELSDLGHATLARRAGITVSFFEGSGSPLRFTYAMEQSDRPIQGRRTRNEYKFAFEQKPGLNQTFSIMLGYSDWRDGLPEGEMWNRVLLNLDYQLRF